jgi:hypothetical protein
MNTIQEKFYALVKESEDEIENFNDFEQHRAIVWASKKIADLEEEIKNWTEGYGLLFKKCGTSKEHSMRANRIANQIEDGGFEHFVTFGDAAPWVAEEEHAVKCATEEDAIKLERIFNLLVSRS